MLLNINHSVGRRLRASPKRWQGAIESWFERSRQRRALSQLGDDSLADLGLSRMDVAREIAKPFWR